MIEIHDNRNACELEYVFIKEIILIIKNSKYYDRYI